MIIKDMKNKQLDILVESKVEYGDIRVGDQLIAYELVETPPNCCDYYKCIDFYDLDDKVHYLFTFEVYL